MAGEGYHAVRPYVRIREAYRCAEHEKSWRSWLNWHHLHGFVFSTPDFFIMGRAVLRDSMPEQIVGKHVFKSEECDCWHIFAMSGDMGKAWSILPWELPWLAWERVQGGKRDLRFYRTDDVRRLTSHAHTQSVLA